MCIRDSITLVLVRRGEQLDDIHRSRRHPCVRWWAVPHGLRASTGCRHLMWRGWLGLPGALPGAPAAEFMPAELASCRASAAVVNTAGSTLKTGLAKAAGERRPRKTPQGRHSPRRGRPDATNRSQPTPLTTTWKRQRPAWKLHVHTWQWHLSGVSLPATDPRTPWHLRCKKIQAGHLTDRLPAANVSQSEYDTAVESRSCSDQNTACNQNTEFYSIRS